MSFYNCCHYVLNAIDVCHTIYTHKKEDVLETSDFNTTTTTTITTYLFHKSTFDVGI